MFKRLVIKIGKILLNEIHGTKSPKADEENNASERFNRRRQHTTDGLLGLQKVLLILRDHLLSVPSTEKKTSTSRMRDLSTSEKQRSDRPGLAGPSSADRIPSAWPAMGTEPQPLATRSN